MPQRPRSHQIEDLSFNRFRDSVPPSWVVRERSRDYGLDLEVEIFTASGHATGLIFYVQLRATDDLERAQQLRFRTDQLDYFRLLDLPTAIIRYSAKDGAMYLMWGFEVPPALHDGDTQTLKFRPDQRWTEETPAQITDTLETLRRLSRPSDTARVALRLVNEVADRDRSYLLQTAVEQLRGLRSFVPAPVPAALAMEVHATPTAVTVRVAKFARVEVGASWSTRRELTSALAWAAVQVLWRLGLKSIANRLAHDAVAAGMEPATPEMAMTGALALLPDIPAAVDLACSAGLHTRQDEHFVVLTTAIHMVRSTNSVEDRIALLRRALDAQPSDVDVTARGALMYSIGNAFRAARDFTKAVGHYKSAIRLHPPYADAHYFWRELGGCFFMRRRFQAAAKAYERALSLSADPEVALLAGDAELCCGRPGRAAELYELSLAEQSVRTPGEALLKLEFCRWLEATYGGAFARPTSQLGPAWKDAATNGSWADVLSADPLDPLANFNEGLKLAQSGDKADAFWRFLAVAFTQPGDSEAWSNALACSLSVDASVVVPTLHLALFHCGRDPYDRLRTMLTGPNRDEFLASFDAIVQGILGLDEDRGDRLTIRLFDGNAFRHVFDVHND